jgi:hypothetical protein
MKVRADVVTVVALLLAGMARFYYPGVPRMIQAICFVAAALAAFTAYTDWRLERQQEAELDELHHRPPVTPQMRLAH